MLAVEQSNDPEVPKLGPLQMAWLPIWLFRMQRPFCPTLGSLSGVHAVGADVVVATVEGFVVEAAGANVVVGA